MFCSFLCCLVGGPGLFRLSQVIVHENLPDCFHILPGFSFEKRRLAAQYGQDGQIDVNRRWKKIDLRHLLHGPPGPRSYSVTFQVLSRYNESWWICRVNPTQHEPIVRMCQEIGADVRFRVSIN